MALGSYMGIDNTARKVNNIYVGVNGIAKRVTKAYVGVNGVAQPFWTIGTLPEFLIDFNGYTTGTEENPTYVITSWRGTLNGEPSTEIVIPNNENIIL